MEYSLANDEILLIGNALINFKGILTYNLTAPIITVVMGDRRLVLSDFAMQISGNFTSDECVLRDNMKMALAVGKFSVQDFIFNNVAYNVDVNWSNDALVAMDLAFDKFIVNEVVELEGPMLGEIIVSNFDKKAVAGMCGDIGKYGFGDEEWPNANLEINIKKDHDNVERDDDMELKLQASALRLWIKLFFGFADIDNDLVNKLKGSLPELVKNGFLIAKDDFYKSIINLDFENANYTVNAQKLTGETIAKILSILDFERAGSIKRLEIMDMALSELDTKFLLALDKHDFKTTAALIEGGANVDVYSDAIRDTPLFLAARNSDYKAVQFLVEHGANVNQQCESGWTPLHEAAENGHLEILKFLHKKGADIDAVDDENGSALYWAASRNRIKAIEYLLENNANTTFKRKESDKTAYDAAAENLFRNAAALIDNAMVKQGLKDPR